MNNQPIKVLLIEDNPRDARLVMEYLSEAEEVRFELEWAERLSIGLDLLAEQTYDVLLLDLSLPECEWLETVFEAKAHAPGIPIVVLTGLDDEALALRAMQEGAQDFLVKGRVNADLLIRSLRHAVECHKLRASPNGLSRDELTDLWNHRSFTILAEHQAKVAARAKTGLWLLLIDVAGLKYINNSYGHREGDRALIKTAHMLRTTFRTSDIIARLHGDQFAVLASDPDDDPSARMIARLRENLQHANESNPSNYKLVVRAGVARFDPITMTDITEVLTKASQALIQEKLNEGILVGVMG